MRRHWVVCGSHFSPDLGLCPGGGLTCTKTSDPNPTFEIPVAGTGPIYLRCKQFLVAPLSKPWNLIVYLMRKILELYYRYLFFSRAHFFSYNKIKIYKYCTCRSTQTCFHMKKRNGRTSSRPSPDLSSMLPAWSKWVREASSGFKWSLFFQCCGSRIHRNWKRFHFQGNFPNRDIDSD